MNANSWHLMTENELLKRYNKLESDAKDEIWYGNDDYYITQEQIAIQREFKRRGYSVECSFETYWQLIVSKP